MSGENLENERSPKEFWKTKCFEAPRWRVGVFLAGKIQQLQIKLPERGWERAAIIGGDESINLLTRATKLTGDRLWEGVTA